MSYYLKLFDWSLYTLPSALPMSDIEGDSHANDPASPDYSSGAPSWIGEDFTFDGGVAYQLLIDDDDGDFEDAYVETGGIQTLAQDVTINGTLYTAGSQVQNEFSMVDAMGNEVWVLRIGGTNVGFVYPNGQEPTAGEVFTATNGRDGDPADSGDGIASGEAYATVDARDGTVTGTSGGDTISAAYLGDPEGDQIDDGWAGGAGTNNNVIDALEGNDAVDAGIGNDTIYAGNGADTVEGGSGNDIIDLTANDASTATIGRWDFDNNADPLDDEATPDNDAVLRGDAMHDTATGSVDLDGTGDYVEIADDPAYDLASATIVMDFQLDTLTGTTGLFTKDAVNSAEGDMTVYANTNGSVVLRWQSDTSDYTITTSAGVLQTGVDHNLHVSLNNGTGDIELYVDGALEGSVNAPGVTLEGNVNPWVVGGRGWASTRGTADTVGNTMDGSVSRFEVLDDAYTPSEVGQLSDGDVDTIVFSDGDGDDTVTGFEGPINNGDGTFTGQDQLDLSGLTDANGRQVNTRDITVGDDGSGNAVLSFPNGETITLLGIAPFEISDEAALAAMGVIAPNDVVEGTAGADVIDVDYTGDPEGDAVDAGDNAAGNNDDVITAGAGNDSIVGNLGNDTILGEAGNDSIIGGAGADILFGGDGDDTVLGGLGDDIIYVGSGTDSVTGGEGADRFIFLDGFGADTIVGGETGTDADSIELQALSSAIDITFSGDEAGSGNAAGNTLLFSEAENFFLTGFDDTVDGSASTSTINIAAGAGNDTIVTGSGDDLVFGQTGADSIDGGAGSDTLNGGAGNDTLRGGDGSDSLNAGAGNDVIYTGLGADTVQTGEGSDTVYLDAGSGTNDLNDSGLGVSDVDKIILNSGPGIYRLQGDFSATDGFEAITGSAAGGEVITTDDAAANFDFFNVTLTDIDEIRGTGNSDNITASAGADSIIGLGGDDLIFAGNGNDTIEAGDGADTVWGGTGADLIEGGGGADNLLGDDFSPAGGNDTMIGGAGDDTLNGNAGDDQLTGGDGNDLFLLSDGNDVITDFGSGETGAVGDGNIFNNDFLNLVGYYDSLDELRADQDDDDTLNQSNELDDEGNTVDYSDNTQFGNNSMTVQGASGSSYSYDNTGIVCFTSDTMILTPRGEVPIDSLKPGDLVCTLDNGPQSITWIGRRHCEEAELRARENLRPILIPTGVLGVKRDLLVSRQHGMLIGQDDLARAIHLTESMPGVRIAHGKREVTYIHLMFEAHQIIFAEGAPSESFYPGPMAMQMMSEDASRDLNRQFPKLLPTLDMPAVQRLYGDTARPFLRKKELPELLVAA